MGCLPPVPPRVSEFSHHAASHPPAKPTQIQEAYATLSDPAKRREYDSVDEFDDSLPLECAPADFFKVGG